MKKITIVSLTQSSTFLVQLKQGNDYDIPKQLIFQGFIINSQLSKRHYFDSLIGKQIDGTINKKNKVLRYQDFQLFNNLLLENGAVFINQKGLSESTVYSQEQKDELKKTAMMYNIRTQKQKQQKKQTQQKKQGQQASQQQQTEESKKQLKKCETKPIKTIIKDFVTNRNQLIKEFRNKKNLRLPSLLQISTNQLKRQKSKEKCQNEKVLLEYLSDEIVIRHQYYSLVQQARIIKYLPLQLKNIDHYFLCLNKAELIPFLSKYRVLYQDAQQQGENKNNIMTEVIIHGAYFNLQRKSYKLKASLSREMQFQIMKAGWGTVSTFNTVSIPIIYLNELRFLQQKARKDHIGIFKPVFQMLSLIYTKNNLVGTIQDVLDGYIYQIRSHSDQTLLKVELTNVYCPIGDQVGAYQCREFARKNLIGKQVNVFLKKNQGLNMHGSISRICDGKDIQNMLLQNGWAHVKQEIKGTLLSSKYQNLQKKAKDKTKGLHKKQLLKDIGVVRFKDLSKPKNKIDYQDNSYLQTRLAFLNSFGQSQEAVVQQIFDALTYKIRLDSKKTIIKMKLQGIKGMQLNPILVQYQQLKKQIKDFLNRNFKKRTVMVSINDYTKEGNLFIGTIKFGEKFKKDFQQALLEQSFVYCDLYSNCSSKGQYLKIQESKMKEKKRLWQQNLLPFKPKRMISEQPAQFKGKFSWIQDGQAVFIQPQSNYQKIDQISTILNQKKLQPLKKEHIIMGVICAAPYGQQQLYRARILSVKNKIARVKFIDWGNTQQINTSNLFYLPESLLYVQRLCVQATLNFVKRLKSNYQCLQKIRQELMQGQFLIQKFIGDSVNVYSIASKEKNIYSMINIQFIEKGYLKADSTKIADEQLRNNLKITQESLRKSRAGVWQFSDKQDTQSQAQEQYDIVMKGGSQIHI